MKLFLALVSALLVTVRSQTQTNIICAEYTEFQSDLASLGDESSFTIYSNYDTEFYGNNEYCSIRLNNGEAPVFITLQFEKFDLEYQQQCLWDWLCVKGVKYCGNSPNVDPIIYAVPANQTFTIRFRSDYIVNRSGFKIQLNVTTSGDDFRSLEPVGISAAPGPVDIANYGWVDESNYVDSCADLDYYVPPTYNSNYTWQDTYTWSSNTTWSYNDTWSSNYTWPDNYTWSDNNNWSDNYTWSNNYTWSGNDTWSNIDTWSNNNTWSNIDTWSNNNTWSDIDTWSNNNTWSDNYTVDYSLDPINTWGRSSEVVQCQNGVSSSVYYLSNSGNRTEDAPEYINNQYLYKSPNFGDSIYNDNTNCAVTFVTSSKPQMLYVEFGSFDVESTQYCTYDKLCLRGVNFCGSWLSHRTLYYEVNANSAFTLRFKTDSSVGRNGLEALIRFSDSYANGFSYEITEGDGSNENSAIYTYQQNGGLNQCAHDPSNPVSISPGENNPPCADSSSAVLS